MAPAAAGDPPMPFEKRLANKALNAHIEKQSVPSPSVPADEPNLLAGAKVYKENCAGCHGLPGQTPPAIANEMYPHAPLLFKGKGVTDLNRLWRVTGRRSMEFGFQECRASRKR